MLKLILRSASSTSNQQRLFGCFLEACSFFLLFNWLLTNLLTFSPPIPIGCFRLNALTFQRLNETHANPKLLPTPRLTDSPFNRFQLTPFLPIPYEKCPDKSAGIGVCSLPFSFRLQCSYGLSEEVIFHENG